MVETRIVLGNSFYKCLAERMGERLAMIILKNTYDEIECSFSIRVEQREQLALKGVRHVRKPDRKQPTAVIAEERIASVVPAPHNVDRTVWMAA